MERKLTKDSGKLSAAQISKAVLERSLEQMEQMVHDIYHCVLAFFSNEPTISDKNYGKN